MGTSGQVIVFPFFGERYLWQFLRCQESIPSHWDVVVITDNDFKSDRFKVIQVPTPENDYEKLIFRRRIPEFVPIDDYSRVWHCDCDVMFTGDLLEKYGRPEYDNFVIVSQEPMTTIDNEHMGKGFDADELNRLRLNRAPAINGGLIGVPISQAYFWGLYAFGIDDFHRGRPDVLSCDQQVLNVIYHRQKSNFALADIEDIGFPTRGTFGKMMNHYIGYMGNKHEIMI